MLRKFVTFLALLSLGLVPTAVQAQNPKGNATDPTIILRVKSFQTLVDSFKTVANAIDMADVAQQVEGVLQSPIGQAGLKGIDTKRPWIVYGKIGEDLQNMGAVLMIPVNDQKAFLNLLANVQFTPEEDANDKGLYIVDQNIQPAIQIGFRFANKFAYITAENFDFIKAGNLLPPNKIKTTNMKAAISGVFRMDQVPGEAYKFLKVQLENQVRDFKENEVSNNNELEKKIQFAIVDEALKQGLAFLKGSKQIAFAFDVDADKKQFVEDVTIEGQPQSQFAKNMVDLAGPGSLFGGLLQKGTMVNGLVTFKLPASIRKVLDEALTKGIVEARKKGKSAKERELIEQFIAGLSPTLKSSVVDGAVSAVTEKDGTLSGVAAIRLVDAKKLEKAIKELHKFIPDVEAKKFNLDFDKVGKANIHQINAQDDYDAQARRILGNFPIYIAFRNDAALLGFGKNGLTQVKRAVAGKKMGKSPVMSFSLAIRDLIPLVSKKEREIAAAKTTFGPNTPGTVMITATQQGLKASIQVRVDLSVLRFAIRADKNNDFGAE
ncbi:MAG: hypothetical protein ACFCD0_09225 [Gemmataceae bacterium]